MVIRGHLSFRGLPVSAGMVCFNVFSAVCGVSSVSFTFLHGGENEGVHSNRLYHGSVMINKTNSTHTPRPSPTDHHSSLRRVRSDRYAGAFTSVCVCVCWSVMLQKMQLLSELTRLLCLCVCTIARHTMHICKRKALMCPQCVFKFAHFTLRTIYF